MTALSKEGTNMETQDTGLGRWADSPDAQAAGEAIAALLAASRRRNITVQWMPEPPGCRFEMVGVHTGSVLAVAHVDERGGVTLGD